MLSVCERGVCEAAIESRPLVLERRRLGCEDVEVAKNVLPGGSCRLWPVRLPSVCCSSTDAFSHSQPRPNNPTAPAGSANVKLTTASKTLPDYDNCHGENGQLVRDRLETIRERLALYGPCTKRSAAWRFFHARVAKK